MASRLPVRRRLRRPAEFAAIATARGPASVRLEGNDFAMKAAWNQGRHPAGPRVRLGITVAKRLARRSVDRSTIKRLVRESFRARADCLESIAAELDADIGITVRWKGVIAEQSRAEVRAWKRRIRADADRLLVMLTQRLDRRS